MILVQSSTGPSSLPLASLEARTQVVSSMRRVIRQSLAAPHDMMTDEMSPCAPCTAVAVYSVVLWLWSHVAIVACSVYTSATGSTLKRFGHSAKQAATCQCQLPWLYALHKAGRVERQRSTLLLYVIALSSLNVSTPSTLTARGARGTTAPCI